MKSSKNKRTGFLVAILLALLILAFKVLMPSEELSFDAGENTLASQRVQKMLNEVENINFDTSVLKDQKFQSLHSIETPLISLPVGRANPFSSASGAN